MGTKVLENPNPKIYPKLEEKLGANEQLENVTRNSDEVDARGIFGKYFLLTLFSMSLLPFIFHIVLNM